MRKGRYYSEKELRSIAAELTSAKAIPVNIEVEAEHRVLDLSEVEKILHHSENIFLQECGCRSQFHNCNAPLDTCLAVNVGANYTEKWPESRKVSVEEALEVLRRSHEAGLVHMTYVFKGEEEPQLICSCCTCCCHTLGGIVDHGITTQVLTSKLIAEDDEAKCVDCGKCVERCKLGARMNTGGKKVYDASKCLGCGLCVTTCPQDAIRLIERKKA
jgi:Pyruvate/2-oxoacid:ferredoxin oxidoreductase delta subunit